MTERRRGQWLRESGAGYLTAPELETVANFLDQLDQQCGDRVDRVILFGSRARGDYEPESDIDLLIVTHSLAYQGARHAATAALYARNVIRTKHSDLEPALADFLVKPDYVEEECIEMLRNLRRTREASDYDVWFTADKRQTDKLVAAAERFLGQHGTISARTRCS